MPGGEMRLQEFLPGESLALQLATGSTKSGGERLIAEKTRRRRGEICGILTRMQSIHPIVNPFPRRQGRAADDGFAKAPCLDEHDSERLMGGGKAEGVASSIGGFAGGLIEHSEIHHALQPTRLEGIPGTANQKTRGGNGFENPRPRGEKRRIPLALIAAAEKKKETVALGNPVCSPPSLPVGGVVAHRRQSTAHDAFRKKTAGDKMIRLEIRLAKHRVGSPEESQIDDIVAPFPSMDRRPYRETTPAPTGELQHAKSEEVPPGTDVVHDRRRRYGDRPVAAPQEGREQTVENRPRCKTHPERSGTGFGPDINRPDRFRRCGRTFFRRTCEEPPGCRQPSSELALVFGESSNANGGYARGDDNRCTHAV